MAGCSHRQTAHDVYIDIQAAEASGRYQEGEYDAASRAESFLAGSLCLIRYYNYYSM